MSLCIYGCVCVHILGMSPCMYMDMSLCTSLDVSPRLCLCVISVSLCSMSSSLFVGVSMMCLASAWVYVSCLWWTGAGTGLPSTPPRPVCDCHMTMVAVFQSPGQAGRQCGGWQWLEPQPQGEYGGLSLRVLFPELPEDSSYRLGFCPGKGNQAEQDEGCVIEGVFLSWS